MTNILPLSFYIRNDVVQVSKELLGKYLVTNIDGQISSGIITETEAYRAADDKACHAYNNRRTKRTEVMFQEGGRAYIYLCYGIHHLFNVVTGKEGTANAVLIRAIKPVDNIEAIQTRRNIYQIKPQLSAGPGVLSKALGLSTALTGTSLLKKTGQIWIEDRGLVLNQKDIESSPRIGIDYAEECVSWPWRFFIKDSKWVSG